jgi:hypothetical protein
MVLLFILLATVASMLLAGHMAKKRGRSVTVWAWVAALVGPFAPLALYFFGNRRTDAAHA